MTKIVNAATCTDRHGNPVVIARVSPTAYRYCNANGSFSNRSGERPCAHMAESVARGLIRTEKGNDRPFLVIATGERYPNRIQALGAAVLAQRDA